LGFFLREKRRWLFRNKKNGVGFFAKSALAISALAKNGFGVFGFGLFLKFFQMRIFRICE